MTMNVCCIPLLFNLFHVGLQASAVKILCGKGLSKYPIVYFLNLSTVKNSSVIYVI